MATTIQSNYNFSSTMEYLNANKKNGIVDMDDIILFNQTDKTGQTENKDLKVTNPAVSLNAKQKEAKAGFQADLDAFKSVGVNVSWAGNICKLEHNGKIATITLDAGGNPKFAGDMEYMQNYLLSASKTEQASTAKYDNFIKQLQANGDEILNQTISNIKINGKDTPVIEISVKSKDGNESKLYLDNNGNQVKPD